MPTVSSNEFKGFLPQGILTGLITMFGAAIIAIFTFHVLSYAVPVNKALALLVFVAILWLTEAVHISLTAIIIPIGAVVLGLPQAIKADGTIVPMTMKTALSGFSHPIIYLFLGGFALSTALQTQKIDRKIASLIIQMTGASLLWATIAICGITAFLSMWMSNTATAAMILPLAIGLLSSVDKNEHGTRIFVLLGIAYSASIGGIGTVIGSPPNLIAATELDMHFIDWLPYGLPIVAILLPLMFLVLLLTCKPNLKQKITQPNQENIPWTKQRILTVIIFCITAIAWIGGKKLSELGISSPDTFVALCAIIVIVSLGVASWKDVTDNADWGVLLLFGGGITLSNILKTSGASLALGQEVAAFFGHLSPFLVILVIATFIIFLTEFTSNTASAALLIPVFGEIAATMGLPKAMLVMIIGIGASCAFMLPVATPPNALVFGTGEIRQKDMLKVGTILNIACIVVISIYAYYFLR